MNARRAYVLAFAMFPMFGCAAILGATFDDTTLESDAGDASDDADAILFGDGAPTNDVTPPFSPSSIPNLVFWIDATREVDTYDGGALVMRWHDLTSYARDAVPTGVVNVPTLVPNALNGLPVVRFTQANLDLLQSSFAGPNAPNVTMFLVSRGDANSALRFQSTAGAYPFFIFPIDVTADAGPLFDLYVGTPQQTYTAVHMRFDGGASLASLTWNANGVAATYDDGELVEQRTNLDPTIPSGQTLYLGGALPLLGAPSTTVPFMNGDLAEALVYTSALPDADREEVEAYLRAKWGISP